ARDQAGTDEVGRALGARALALPGDITADGIAAAIVRRTLDRFGRVDVLVNNAAHARSTRFEQLGAEEWRLALETNMTAPYLLMKAVLPAMRAPGYGRIINVSSSAGRMVSKHGG